MLHGRVGPREESARAARVRPANRDGRGPLGPVSLEDLGIALRLTEPMRADDDAIAAEARSFGAPVVITSPDCPSGTDRVAVIDMVARKLVKMIDGVGDQPWGVSSVGELSYCH